MARSLALALSLLLAGCFGAYQVKADNPTGAGALRPTVEDKDAGLVGIAPGFDVKTYAVIAVALFPVTDSAVKTTGTGVPPRRCPSSSSPNWCVACGRAASSLRS